MLIESRFEAWEPQWVCPGASLHLTWRADCIHLPSSGDVTVGLKSAWREYLHLVHRQTLQIGDFFFS